jgi:hypothetical protein
VTAPADRAGQLWENKPRGSVGGRYPFRILGWVDFADLNARAESLEVAPFADGEPGLWVGLTRSIFGQPFLFTIGDGVLRSAHRRVPNHERSPA